MNKATFWIAAVVGGAGLAVGIGSQAVRAPAILAGANLATATGLRPDPHLLSALPDAAIAHACSLVATCVHAWSLLAFALMVAAIAALAGRVDRTHPIVAGLLVAAAVAASPFATASIVDPLGLAMTVSGLLVVAAAASLVATRRVPLYVECAIACAMALQDPILTVAAAVYAILAGLRLRKPAGLAPVAAVAIAAAIRFAIAPEWFQALEVDATSASPTILAIGLGLFGLGPILFLVWRRWGPPVDYVRRAIVRIALFGVAVFIGGFFAPTGDPTPYWFFAGIAAVVWGLWLLQAPRLRTTAAVLLVCLTALQCFALVRYYRSIPSVTIAQQSIALRDFAQTADHDGCISTDPLGRKHVLADGGFTRLYGAGSPVPVRSSLAACMSSLTTDGQLTTIGDTSVTVWGRIVPLVSSFDRASRGNPLGIAHGTVSPRTPAKTPTGLGAFDNVVSTPLGLLADFTLLSGYRYAYPCVQVAPAQRLAFGVATLPGSSVLDYEVHASADGKTTTIIKGVVPASAPGPTLTWHSAEASLPPGRCVSLTFSVSDPRGTTGKWMIFAGASVL